MRTAALLMGSMALVVLLACGVALAATIDCSGGGALCFGTDEPDTLNGSPERDEMFGQRGDDTLKGAAGNDSLEGQGGVDNVRGGNGNDYLEGNERADRLHGGPGADGLVDNSYRVGPLAPPSADHNALFGEAGDDNLVGSGRLDGGPGDDLLMGTLTVNDGAVRTLTGGPGQDRIRSNGRVNDTINADDNTQDKVSCGSGQDTVFYDEGVDNVKPVGCETLIAR